MTTRTEDELLAEQLSRPGQLEAESNAWWAMFIEHWAERGADRRALNDAVVRFRAAQTSLTAAIEANKRQH